MMSRHFGLSSEPTGAIAKRLPCQKSASGPDSFFNQFVTDIYIRIYSRTRLVRTPPGSGKKYVRTSTRNQMIIKREFYNYAG